MDLPANHIKVSFVVKVSHGCRLFLVWAVGESVEMNNGERFN